MKEEFPRLKDMGLPPSTILVEKGGRKMRKKVASPHQVLKPLPTISAFLSREEGKVEVRKYEDKWGFRGYVREAFRIINKFGPRDWMSLWWLSQTPLSFHQVFRLCYEGERMEGVRRRLDSWLKPLILDKVSYRFFQAYRGLGGDQGSLMVEEGRKEGYYDCYFLGPMGDYFLRNMGYVPSYELYFTVGEDKTTSPLTTLSLAQKLFHMMETNRLFFLFLEEGEGRKYRLKAWRPEAKAHRGYFVVEREGKRKNPLLRKSFRPDGMLEFSVGGREDLVSRFYLEYVGDKSHTSSYLPYFSKKVTNYLEYWRYGEWRWFYRVFPSLLIFCEDAHTLSLMGEGLAMTLCEMRRRGEIERIPFSLYLSCYEYLLSSPSISSSPWMRLRGRDEEVPLLSRGKGVMERMGVEFLSFEEVVEREITSVLPPVGREEVERRVEEKMGRRVELLYPFSREKREKVRREVERWGEEEERRERGFYPQIPSPEEMRSALDWAIREGGTIPLL